MDLWNAACGNVVEGELPKTQTQDTGHRGTTNGAGLLQWKSLKSLEDYPPPPPSRSDVTLTARAFLHFPSKCLSLT